MLQVHVRSFWLPKAGNTDDEYEDAFYPHYSGQRSGKQLQFAIADGASEGMLSGPWAQILVRAFCRQTSPGAPMDELLARAHYAWVNWQAHYLKLRERQNRPVQWYEEPGLAKGAFSTLLGLALTHESKTSTLTALALGDSCLFQVRDNRLLTAFPVAQAADFDNRPFLIASNPTLNKGLDGHVRQMQHDVTSGDRLLLMTDALAQWFLTESEAGRAPWTALTPPRQPDSNPEHKPHHNGFSGHVQGLRDEHRIRNDDVTLIVLDIG